MPNQNKEYININMNMRLKGNSKTTYRSSLKGSTPIMT